MDEEALEVELQDATQLSDIAPSFPVDKQVIAIDSTSFNLGDIPNGIVCATRASVIVKPAGTAQQRLELYGPFLTAITNQNKDRLYSNLYQRVCGPHPDVGAPDVYKVMDRIRNLFERHLQLLIAKSAKDSLILLDGSLIGATVANPMSLIREIMDTAAENNNSIIAISKSTNLTLKESKKSILSLLDGKYGPCYFSGIKDIMEQARRKYVGDIYVVKLTPLGEPFRLDIATNSPIPHTKVLEMVAGLAGDYGYPEELKLAHSTCVHSAVEIMELQAAAIKLYNLQIKEDLRSKLFPLG